MRALIVFLTGLLTLLWWLGSIAVSMFVIWAVIHFALKFW